MNYDLGRVVKLKLKKPACAYCSMTSEFACDAPGCQVAMCEKHINNRQVDGRDLCRKHRSMSADVDNRKVFSLTKPHGADSAPPSRSAPLKAIT